MPTTHYLWDFANDSYLMEKDGTGGTTAVYTNEPVQFGRVISQRRGNATSYYHFDAQQSTRELTDQDQAVTDSHIYDAFGAEIARTGTTTNPFAYAGMVGYYKAPETVDSFIRRRQYKSLMGRWLSADVAAVETALNLYTYVSNNPITLIDPSGLYPCCCCCAETITANWFRHIQDIVDDNMNRIGLSWGHIFTVYAHLSFKWSSLKAGEKPCDVEWYECGTSGGSLGQKANEWFEAHKAGEIPGTFFGAYKGGFELACDPNPPSNRQSFTLIDKPMANYPSNQTVKFAISLTSSPDCDCYPLVRTKYYTQRLVTRVQVFSPNPAKIYTPSDLPHDKWEITPGISDSEEPTGCTRAKLSALIGKSDKGNS